MIELKLNDETTLTLSTLSGYDSGKVSDGYHTFDELYGFRKLYNAALFNEWAAQGKYQVHKSQRHFDDELCFGGGWFIVVAMLPTGQISNHYRMDDWELFQIPSYQKVLFEFDGHTPSDVCERLHQLCLLHESGKGE